MGAGRIIIVGAGLIGAAVAYRLTRQGRRVTLVDAAAPASGASGHSFGWINASFFVDDTHHNLRVAALSAWHRLQAELPDLAIRWPGCLWWEEQGEGLARRQALLEALGYAVERLDAQEIATREPALRSVPDEALLFPQEGVADPAVVTGQLLEQARANGADLLLGTPVEAIEERSGRVTGLRTAQGVIEAEQVLVAAGTGSAALMQSVGVPLPMLRRPGALVRTKPVSQRLKHVLVSPDLEIRQDHRGRILAPSSAAHQVDDREVLADTPDRLAADTIRRLQILLPEANLSLDQVSVALRPVPRDGLPAVGACGPEGLYLAVLHSGVTLAALMGELVAAEFSGEGPAPLLAPYRPGRFAADCPA